jgi:hypothetical protein
MFIGPGGRRDAEQGELVGEQGRAAGAEEPGLVALVAVVGAGREVPGPAVLFVGVAEHAAACCHEQSDGSRDRLGADHDGAGLSGGGRLEGGDLVEELDVGEVGGVLGEEFEAEACVQADGPGGAGEGDEREVGALRVVGGGLEDLGGEGPAEAAALAVATDGDLLEVEERAARVVAGVGDRLVGVAATSTVVYFNRWRMSASLRGSTWAREKPAS